MARKRKMLRGYRALDSSISRVFFSYLDLLRAEKIGLSPKQISPIRDRWFGLYQYIGRTGDLYTLEKLLGLPAPSEQIKQKLSRRKVQLQKERDKKDRRFEWNSRHVPIELPV